MSHPLYFAAVQLRIIQALYQCSNRIICVKLLMRMVLRNAESFFVIFNRLIDISGSHTNIEDLFDNITRKYHKLIQQLPRWSWKYSCGNGPNLSQNKTKSVFTHIKITSKPKNCEVCARYGTYQGIQPVYTAGMTGTGLFD